MRVINQSEKYLSGVVKFWFILATIGQFAFGIYVLSFYGGSTLQGDFAKWNNVLPHGYTPGDWKGNFTVGIHVLFAAILIFGGPLQIMPFIRNRFGRFHRILGKVYLFTAVLVSVAGVIMVFTKGSVGDQTMHYLICVQVIYILWFAVKTIQEARAKHFESHRKWALRLFMVTNGVWFFRIGLMAWLFVFQKPVGFDPETFTGPFLTTLSVFTYAIPIALLLLESYFYAQKKANPKVNWAVSFFITIFSLITLLGVIGAVMGLWLPRIF
ncbi:MAG: DUF2306 domain-containing protein [Saprospiraceae bacterium]